jgi:hypothetical protein
MLPILPAAYAIDGIKLNLPLVFAKTLQTIQRQAETAPGDASN